MLGPERQDPDRDRRRSGASRCCRRASSRTRGAGTVSSSASGSRGSASTSGWPPSPCPASPQRIVVVARSLRDRERGIDSLLSAMAVAFPLGLLLAVIAGYIVSALVVAAGRADAPAGRDAVAGRARRAPAGAGVRRRDRGARRVAQRHDRAPRAVVRAGAPADLADQGAAPRAAGIAARRAADGARPQAPGRGDGGGTAGGRDTRPTAWSASPRSCWSWRAPTRERCRSSSSRPT